MIRIVLAEDHEVVRAGIRELLEKVSGFRVVAETADGSEVAGLVEEFGADVLVVDLALHSLDGIEAIRRTKKARPQTRVVVLTMHRDDAHVSEALKAGASAYVLKDDSFDHLVAAVRAALRGEYYASEQIPVLPELDGQVLNRYELLTTREREILHLVAEGRSSEEIADLLHLSIKTVSTHRANIWGKLGENNLARMIRFVLERGLVPPPISPQ